MGMQDLNAHFGSGDLSKVPLGTRRIHALLFTHPFSTQPYNELVPQPVGRGQSESEPPASLGAPALPPPAELPPAPALPQAQDRPHLLRLPSYLLLRDYPNPPTSGATPLPARARRLLDDRFAAAASEGYGSSPEVAEYPETGRFGLLAEMPPTVDGKPRELRFVGRSDESLDYWLGE
jgi:hypothetical protein